jgi:hypothetical protein
MHSTIERAARYESVYVPEDYIPIIEKCKRKGKKYEVQRVAENMLDFHLLAERFQNWNHRAAKWKTVREFAVDPDNPGKVFLKHDLSSPDYLEIKITLVGRPVNLEKFIFKRAYEGPIALKKKKLADLASMCDALVIPSSKHDFYTGLLNFPPLRNPLLVEEAEGSGEEDNDENEVDDDDDERDPVFTWDYENDDDEDDIDYEEELRTMKAALAAQQQASANNGEPQENEDGREPEDEDEKTDSEAGSDDNDEDYASDSANSDDGSASDDD